VRVLPDHQRGVSRAIYRLVEMTPRSTKRNADDE
jgi:hypothetical protein